MFIPLISTVKSAKLNRRKGGGGGFKGFKGSINVAGSSKSVTAYGSGGGRITTLPVYTGTGPNFGGRKVGGGDRKSVYGSRVYGSGYPGVSGRGVDGRGFPYSFWPIIWMSALSLTATSVTYLYSSEYSLPGSTDRPGGVMMSAAFKSENTGTIYRVVADNTTVIALAQEIHNKCSTLIADSNIVLVGNTSDSSQAQPEQALQYYRASTVVLTMDGYNNSATFGPEGTPDTELPNGIDTVLLDCLNNTIGSAVPLVDSGSVRQNVWNWILVSLCGVILILGVIYLCIHGTCFALCLIC